MPDPISFASPSITDDDIDAVVRVLRSGWITTGAECFSFEDELGEYLGGSEVVAVSSCTAALEIALASLDLPPGARVAVPTWTFVSTALAVLHRGHTPVLVDVEQSTLNIDANALESAIDSGLDAVVPVHFGGVPIATEVHNMCRAASLPVIEDAAHAIGATDHRGRLAGQGSVAACFSFYATKNIATAEGGAIVTDRPEVAAFARTYRLHGLSADAWKRYDGETHAPYDLVGPGLKANLPDVLAALGRTQLRRFDQSQATRRVLATRYRANLAGSVDFVPAVADAGSADHLMVVLLPRGADRDAVAKRMTEAGVATSVHFQPLHRFDWLRENADLGGGRFDTADDAWPRALSLPLHCELTDRDVDRVCTALEDALRLEQR